MSNLSEDDLKISFYDSKVGDAIHIRYKGKSGSYRNVLIDGGYKYVYRDRWKTLIDTIQDKDEKIDVWCITHVDTDHINCIIEFLSKSPNQSNLIQEVWFNHNENITTSDNTQTGIPEGKNLRSILIEKNIVTNSISAVSQKKLDGAVFDILSPTNQQLDALLEEWSSNGISQTRTSGKEACYDKNCSELLRWFEGSHSPNTSAINQSSIAFIFRCREYKALFLGDSTPNIINESLTSLGYKPSKKLKVDLVKLSHHGSKYNINKGFLNLIDSHGYVITANGTTHPHKETLCLIVDHLKDSVENIEFIFSCSETEKLKNISLCSEDETSNIDKVTFVYKDPEKEYVFVSRENLKGNWRYKDSICKRLKKIFGK